MTPVSGAEQVTVSGCSTEKAPPQLEALKVTVCIPGSAHWYVLERVPWPVSGAGDQFNVTGRVALEGV